MKIIAYIALGLSVLTYTFWESFYKGFFYHGNALVFLMLCMYLFLTNKNSFVFFVFFSYSINNLADELFFYPGILGKNEIVFAFAVPLLWILKKIYNARKNTSK